ncbi:MAG TPA: ChuX/HutX family heme-like substrate-binding protein [Terrimicrobiaceae bacterium]
MKTEEKESLKARWDALVKQRPKLRIRDAARELGVGEAQLLATNCGDRVTRLEGEWTQLIKEFPRLGRVMCLTRNEHAVHERYGEFRQIDFFNGMGQVVGPDIDLRLFMRGWRFGFAATDFTSDGERQSFQFFDAAGEAIHKVYLQKSGNLGAYGELLHRFRSPNQFPWQSVEKRAEGAAGLPDAEIDVRAFQQAWRELKDTHAFFNILQKFRVAREQALRLAPEGYARRVETASTRGMLESAAAESIPIMVFIGNRGCLQIHTGPVHNIRMFGTEWLNVLDDGFNMHLRDTAVASAWVVRKPTTDGDVTSLELFDSAGNTLAIFFGKQKPGSPETEAWRKSSRTCKAGRST